MSTPNEVIVQFLADQPVQLQQSIGGGIALAFGIIVGQKDDIRQIMSEVVDAGANKFEKTMRAAAVIGTIDYYFSEPPLAIDALPQKEKVEFVNAYNARAQAAWSALRQSTLSHEALSEFQAMR